MTSAQVMPPGSRQRLPAQALALMATILLGGAAGCTQKQQLAPPAVLQAPYEKPQTWAVAPPLNESGVSTLETHRVADIIAAQVQQIDGLDAMPVNRVIAAQRELKIPAVRTIGDAQSLMNLLDVDGLIVGTVFAYEAYPPFSVGMILQLFERHANPRSAIDPVRITHTTSGEVAPGSLSSVEPVAQAAGVFDAHNHGTLLLLRHYAAGRHMPDSAFGPDIYLVRMDLFTEFVSHLLVRQLLGDEQTPQVALTP